MFKVLDCTVCDSIPAALVLLAWAPDPPTDAVLVGPVEPGNCDSPFVVPTFALLDFGVCEAIDGITPVLTVSKLPGPETTEETLNFAVLESTGDGTIGAVPLDLTTSEITEFEFLMSDDADVSLVIDLAGNRVVAAAKGLLVALDPIGTGIIGFGASEWMVEAGVELDPEEPVELPANALGDVEIDCGSVDELADGSDAGVRLVPESEGVDVIIVGLNLDDVDTKATVPEVLVIGNASLGDIKLVDVGLVVIGALGIVVFEASGGVSVGLEILVGVPGICGMLNSSVVECDTAELVVEVSELCVVLNSSVVDCEVVELTIEDGLMFDAVASFDVRLLDVATITGSGVVRLVVEGMTGSGVVGLVVEGITSSGVDELVVEEVTDSGVEELVVEEVADSGAEELAVEEVIGSGAEELVVDGVTGNGVVRLDVKGITGSGVVGLVVDGMTGSGAEELIIEEVTDSGADELVVEKMTDSGAEELVVEEVTDSGTEEPVVEETTNGGVEVLIVEGDTAGGVVEIEVRLNVVGVVVGVVSDTV